MIEQPAEPGVTGFNKQSPVARLKTFDGYYRVHSTFLTIQGEGPFSGDAAFFIRLRDCNLQCPGCDTDYTGDARAVNATAKALLDMTLYAVRGTQCTLVVITGGEPFRQDLADLVFELRTAGFRVQIETNGTLAPSDAFKEKCGPSLGVAIVVSPKAYFVDPWIECNAIAYKYVLTHGKISDEDGLPTEVLGRRSVNGVARPLKGIPHIFVQPADMIDDDVLTALNHKAAVDAATRFGYRLQLQIHKHLGVE